MNPHLRHVTSFEMPAADVLLKLQTYFINKRNLKGNLQRSVSLSCLMVALRIPPSRYLLCLDQPEVFLLRLAKDSLKNFLKSFFFFITYILYHIFLILSSNRFHFLLTHFAQWLRAAVSKSTP